ncbi:pyridoxamine 5'-phosphate oxidase [Oligoflexus tunisiensis]|uniref:pyridoxamine 5'-phosphate oxidase n=1 Tax=Oligoflexus tunisiensis TaxID=708132 RepID=UPI000AC21A3A|nr:pyridoxamine 5'-phosphate oxidase [Oligoflexus tunisiensis]
MASNHQDPINLFAAWFAEAKASTVRDPTAMALATASRDLMPAVRMVLMKQFDHDGLVFYTNLTSAKARDLLENPQASVCFHWEPLKRQVRVAGSVERVSDAEADAYFASRPRESQLGAWASLQSQPMKERAEFEARLAMVTKRYEGQIIPRPPHWSGFRIIPSRIEFWTDRPFRLHDRLVFSRQNPQDPWQTQILYP